MDKKLYQVMKQYLATGRYQEAYDCLTHIYEEDGAGARWLVLQFRSVLKKAMLDGYSAEKTYSVLHDTYILTAKDSFDDFMIALEWYRADEDKFWLVRREQLLPVCDALEALLSDDLDELFLSMPPRVGKTTIVMFFSIWYMMKFPDKSNLYASFSETTAKTFYNGVLEVLMDPATYDIEALFPTNKVKRTDAKDLLIDINRKKRYASLTCRSVDGSLNGSCDAEGILIADDLHSGIDEARSKDLLIKKWETVRANFLSRKKGTAKILWIGTHWSLIDCISQRIEMLQTSPECAHIRYRILNVPALNENDESNFDYLFHKGFTTNDFKTIRASYESTGDMALWLAPYMGMPIERDGAVFSPEDLRYYNGELPPEEPDRIFMAVDPAWGGGDYVSAPVIYQYGDDLFVHDVVFNNGDKYVTEPLVVNKAIDNDVAAMYIEATRVTSGYAEDVDRRLREHGYRVNLQSTTKHWSSQNGKKQRIFDKAPEIRERFIFRETSKRPKEYVQFMNNLFSFTMEGKNKHDDAPDSLAMVLYNTTTQMNKIQLMSRRSIGA